MQTHKNKKPLLWIITAAVIAGLYAGLSFAGYGFAYGATQFRFAEALTLLPVLTSAAIPGLTIGCVIVNIGSSFGLLDIIFGSLATLLAALCTYALRNITLFRLPLLSALMPVIFNAAIVGAVITLSTGGAAEVGAFEWTVFFSAAASVGLSEMVICYALGVPLTVVLRRLPPFRKKERGKQEDRKGKNG
ncbi:MAG: QueT transporter family protein [Oscillospiraceae bacterium]|jgi:uncharacterized membrane protein|nr:QueT transporter family protein [Oscillospiraceae bacterium]